MPAWNSDSEIIDIIFYMVAVDLFIDRDTVSVSTSYNAQLIRDRLEVRPK